MFKKYRLLRKLTQEKLADKTDLDTRTIQRIENNEKTPSMETFAKMVKVLDIPNDEVIEYILLYARNIYKSNRFLYYLSVLNKRLFKASFPLSVK